MSVKENFPPFYKTNHELMQAILAQRPKKIYREKGVFVPFVNIYSDDYHQHLDLRYLLTSTRRRIYLAMWDNEKLDSMGKALRLGMTTSEERVMKFAANILRRLSGGAEIPMEKKTAELILEMYFRRRRDRGKNPMVSKVPFIQRQIIQDCIRDGEIYPRQVVERYGVSVSRGISILSEMCKAGLLKRSRKIGRVIIYSLAIDSKEVTRLLEAVRSILDLVRLPSIPSQDVF